MATINGTFNSLIAGTLSGTVATPGATGPAGPAGPVGPQGVPGAPGVGVPAGGTTGQFLTKSSNLDYATGWSTLSLAGYATESWVTAGFYPLTGNPSGFLTASALTPYLTKADNLGSLTNFATARDNLNLGTLNNPTFAGLTLQGSGANVGQYTPTSLSLSHTTFGSFVISPSSGITFPDASVQTTAFVAGSGLPTGGTVGQVLTKNSGTNFDASFATLIPGDRYLTTSTTSNTLSNTTKTFTIGTGLSYTPTQSITISYDASNHMHGEVLTYNSGTGVLTVDINHHTGSGTYASWTVNVGGVVPAASVAWGGITGTLGNQTDLATALNAKLEVTTAASTYFTIASAAGKANLSGATFTGKVNLPDLGVNTPSLNLGGTALSTTATSAASGDVWISGATSPKLTYKVGGANLYCATSNLTNTFTSSQIIDVTTATSAALRVTQKGTANAIEVEDSTTPDATRFVVDQFGKVGIGVAPDTYAALKVDTNGIMFGDGTTQTTKGIPDAPADGSQYARKNNAWEVVAGGGGGVNFNWADLISSGIFNVSFTITPEPNPEEPIGAAQIISFEYCCPNGFSNLISQNGGLYPNFALYFYDSTTNVQTGSWSINGFSTTNTFTSGTYSLPAGSSYYVKVVVNLDASTEQKSRYVIGGFTA
jgi:hypothetical protein